MLCDAKECKMKSSDWSNYISISASKYEDNPTGNLPGWKENNPLLTTWFPGKYQVMSYTYNTQYTYAHTIFTQLRPGCLFPINDFWPGVYIWALSVFYTGIYLL